MPSTEHISTAAFERYAARNCAPAETLAVQRHVAACQKCRGKLAQAFNAGDAFAAMRNSFAFEDLPGEPEHLSYERLALFADEKLDAVEREIAESHFAVCAECAEDLADLLSYRKIADALAFSTATSAVAIEKTSEKTSAKKSFWKKLFDFGSIGSFAPVAAVLLIGVLFGAWFLIGYNRTPEIARTDTNLNAPSPVTTQSPDFEKSSNVNSSPDADTSNSQNSAPPNASPETLLALRDGQISVAQNGVVNGLETLSAATQKAVRQSLQSGKISVSPVADSFGGNGGVLMSGGNEANGVPFALQTPVGKVIRESQPILRWKPLKDAVAYNVAIVDDKFRVVAESGNLTAAEWKPSKPLPRGANFSWQVTAVKADGTETVSPAAPAPQARFRIVEQALNDEINRLEKSNARSHLALGVLYANAGLKQEARRELQSLVKRNPNSAIARRLLAGIR